MDNQDIWSMFTHFNMKYFWGELDKVKVSWSPHMTLCAGKTAYRVRGHSCKSCSIRLSQPLLSQRPHTDTVNTLLHEMIHAYLHVTQGLNYRDSHGPEFRKHMKRINDHEGSKITIYHNFQREVDKFRIHVYRCDGPCTTRRPFFGILRRAIERPPGPCDKWWARHQQECGGAFHKIEGPGRKAKQMPIPKISNSINFLNKKPLFGSKISNSYNHSNIEYHNSDRNMIHKSKIQGTHNRHRGTSSKGKSRKTVQQSLSSDGNRSYNEDHILQRIKTKYSNPKRSILLSKEDTKIAYRVQQQNRRNRGNSPEKGILVDGNVNYNYFARSSSSIDLQKYLNRFCEASKSKSCVTQKPNVLNIKYKSEASNIIEKYMNRFYETKRETNLPQLSESFSESNVVHTVPSTVTSNDKSYGSHRRENQSTSSYQESSRTSSCPICSISVPTAVYEQHIQECFGDDLDMEMDEQYEKKETKKGIKGSGKVIENNSGKVNNDWTQLEAKSCPNCCSLVLAAEMKFHLEYCIDSDDDDVKYEPPSELSDESERILPNLPAVHNATDVVSCPSCMENIKEKFIQDHLSECLPLFSEEFE